MRFSENYCSVRIVAATQIQNSFQNIIQASLYHTYYKNWIIYKALKTRLEEVF